MKNKPNTLRFQDLRQIFEKSGFEVVLTDTASLKKLSKKAHTKKRSIAARPGILGLILPDESKIAVNKNIPLEERVKTLLHELVHLYDSGLSETETERAAQDLYSNLSEEDLGYAEFLVS